MIAIHVDPEVRDQLRAIAYEQKLPLRSLVCAGLNAVFAQHHKADPSANQTGTGDVGVGGRHDSVRNKRAFWPNSSAAGNMTLSVFRICPIKYPETHSMNGP